MARSEYKSDHLDLLVRMLENIDIGVRKLHNEKMIMTIENKQNVRLLHFPCDITVIIN